MITKDDLEGWHRDIARQLGQLALDLAKGKTSRHQMEWLSATLRRVSSEIDKKLDDSDRRGSGTAR